MIKNIETRKNEVRFTTNNPQEMLGKFLAKILSCNYIIDQEFSMAYTEQ